MNKTLRSFFGMTIWDLYEKYDFVRELFRNPLTYGVVAKMFVMYFQTEMQGEITNQELATMLYDSLPVGRRENRMRVITVNKFYTDHVERHGDIKRRIEHGDHNYTYYIERKNVVGNRANVVGNMRNVVSNRANVVGNMRNVVGNEENIAGLIVSQYGKEKVGLRMVKIYEMARSGQRISAGSLSLKLGVSSRTIQRDLQKLRNMGVMKYDYKSRRWEMVS